MKQKIYRFCLSAFLYWFIASFACYVLEIPDKVINIAAFVPPVLGLMWGMPAAVGLYVGALFVVPDLQNLFATTSGVNDWLMHFVRAFWAFLAGWLPYRIWHKWSVYSEKYPFTLSVHTLKKFLLVMFVTFAATSVFRALTVTGAELKALNALMEPGRVATPFNCLIACFMNDFFLAIFYDLVWFFFLVSIEYPFANPAGIPVKTSAPKDDNTSNEKFKAWLIALGFYMLFPLVLAYMNKFQIYGMDRIDTWLPFVAQCLTAIDVYLVLMLYLLLRYRRSIMLEVVFLVTQTVFFTASVLGWSNSVSIDHMVKDHTNESLRAMSVICRERLYRTFFLHSTSGKRNETSSFEFNRKL